MLYTFIYSYLLPLLVLFVFASKSYKSFWVLIIYSLTLFILNLYFDQARALIGKKPYSLVYTFIEYSCFTALLFAKVRSHKIRTVVVGISLAFFIFQILYFTFFKQKFLDSIPIGIQAILIFSYIFYFFFVQITSINAPPLYRQHTFWIAIGILIYFSGNFFFYILVNHMTREQIASYWFITYIFDIIKNILFSIAVIVYSRPSKDPAKTEQANTPYLDFS